MIDYFEVCLHFKIFLQLIQFVNILPPLFNYHCKCREPSKTCPRPVIKSCNRINVFYFNCTYLFLILFITTHKTFQAILIIWTVFLFMLIYKCSVMCIWNKWYIKWKINWNAIDIVDECCYLKPCPIISNRKGWKKADTQIWFRKKKY